MCFILNSFSFLYLIYEKEKVRKNGISSYITIRDERVL